VLAISNIINTSPDSISSALCWHACSHISRHGAHIWRAPLTQTPKDTQPALATAAGAVGAVTPLSTQLCAPLMIAVLGTHG
jgi:hypothetical protein